MSINLDEVNHELKDLSVAQLTNLVADLAGLMKQVAAELRDKTSSNSSVIAEDSSQKGIRIPGLYRPTIEEVETSLKSIFTPEELEAAAKIDLNHLPSLPKTMAEYISEDREDRF